MMVQFSKVTFSQYQARYSPLTVLFFTTTFLACQKASLVSKSQSSNTASSMYWKEYFPFMRTLVKRRPVERIMKYSAWASQSSISILWTDQPNSGETMSQPVIFTSEHSRRALMPWSLVSAISMWWEYHKAARHSSVISELRMVKCSSCQKGYRRLKKQWSASTSAHSLKALSPSAGPSKMQSFTRVSRRP